MDGGRFHTCIPRTTKAVCAASNKRATTAQGRGRPGPRRRRTRSASRSPPARSAGPRWRAAVPIMVDGECIGGIGVSGGDWETDERSRAPRSKSIGASWIRMKCDMATSRCASPASAWAGGRTCWPTPSSARASSRSSPATRARRTSARPSPQKYGCQAGGELRRRAGRPSHRSDHQHHAERRAPARPRSAAAAARQARVPRQADRQHRRRRPRHHRGVPQGRRRAGARLSAPAREPFPLGASSRSTPARSASWSTPRPTSAATGSARSISPPGAITAAGMPGGVMLQIGIHYTDVLEYLMGPVKAVQRAASRSWCCRATTRTSRA